MNLVRNKANDNAKAIQKLFETTAYRKSRSSRNASALSTP